MLTLRWGHVLWGASGPLGIANYWLWSGQGWLIVAFVAGIIATLVLLALKLEGDA